VAKVSADGSQLIYCGYIGGSYYEYGTSIAVDSAGNAYIAGQTDSSDFPVVGGPDLTSNGGRWDFFVAKVKADPSEPPDHPEYPMVNFHYCGYIGGSDGEGAGGIVIDSSNCAYVMGTVYSDENSFPVKVGPDLTYNGDGDIFVAKVKADPTEPPGHPDYPMVNLHYCGYIGGTDSEYTKYGRGIALDSWGNVYVTGFTSSSENEGFPVVVGPDLTFNDKSDAFVAKVRKDGSDLDYCGYIGGYSNEFGRSIAVDSSGCAYVTGETTSLEDTFPVKIGPDLTSNGGSDAFVAKVEPDGSELIYCGYIGGDRDDGGHGIVVDASGSAYITGFAYENNDFPVVTGPDLTHNGHMDIFVAKIADIPQQVYLYVDDDNIYGPWYGSHEFPFQYIQDGIDAAAPSDTVLVLPGSYRENVDFNGKAITVRSDEDGDSGTYDVSPGATVINGEQNGSTVTFESGESSATVIDGFTITNGLATGTASAAGGGGIRCDNTSPTIKNNIISGNKSTNSGGGIKCWYASPTVTDNIIHANIAGYGTTSYSGGAIACSYSFATITGNTLTGNRAGYGGGGIYCYESTPVISKNIIDGNTVGHYGGGILCYADSSPAITDNRITGNHSDGDGGGIACYWTSPDISNNLVEDNSAGEDGGGIWSVAVPSVPAITNSTVTLNTAGGVGGGICCGAYSSPVVVNTIVWENVAATGAEISVESGNPTVSYSDVRGGWSGIGNIDADPLFADGPLGNRYLSQTAAGQTVDSPCVDAGDPLSVVVVGTTRTDQIQDAGTVDMGYHYPLETPDFALLIDPNPLIAQQNATFTMTGGDPLTNTFLAYSLDGMGTIFVPTLNVVLNLAKPKKGAGPKATNSAGTVSWTLTIPGSVAGRDVWFQGVQFGKATAVVATSVQ